MPVCIRIPMEMFTSSKDRRKWEAEYALWMAQRDLISVSFLGSIKITIIHIATQMHPPVG